MTIGRLSFCALVMVSTVVPAAETKPTVAGLAFFEAKVRPVLVKHCYSCHSVESKKARGKLLVDTRKGLLVGGETGPAVVPGKPLSSLLLKAVRHDGIAMPPTDRLSSAIVADLEKWVRMGAPDPRDGSALATAATIDLEKGRRFWAFLPPRRSVLPAVRDAAWSHDPIDRFLLARLEAKGLRPAQDASRATLLRRVSLDLTGLPPTLAESEAFLDDRSPEALSRVVDRLLASPGFGERWGRHWLDVVRYADSNGKDENLTFHEAYRFRDHIYESFNEDKPFDQLTREHIAGDLLPASSAKQREDQLTATGFLVIGPKVLADRDVPRRKMDVLDEQIDTLGRAFLGLTLGCARCHDHKFDPVPTADYYALAGIFSSTRTLDGFKLGNPVVSGWSLRPLDADGEKMQAALVAHQARLKGVGDEIRKARADLKTTEDRAGMRLAGSLGGIVVDDREAKLIGDWKKSTFTLPYVGVGYLHDDRSGKGTKSATFTPKLDHAAEYEVFVSYTPGTSRADNVPVTIRHAAGTTTVHVDQRPKPKVEGLFVSVGRYRFTAGSTGSVTISNKETTGHVIVDAVRFTPLGKAPEKFTAGIPAEVQKQLDTTKLRLRRLETQETTLKATTPPAPRLVMAVRDEIKPADIPIAVRGNVHQPGAIAKRGLVTVASWAPMPEIAKKESGRRELADWLADERNPLTARVLVNRVWQHLFGEGLVRTPDNFGLQGERPTHPELLDTLAVDFMADGWSVKRLVRRIVLSRAYGMAVVHDAEAVKSDPENRLLWRANRRRLDAEVIRDGMLHVAGRLDRRMGGSAVTGLGEQAINNTSKGGLATDDNLRRSVYLPVIRNDLPALFEVFDFADPDVGIGRRDTTIVPTQALFLLNSPFVRAAARAAATRLLAEPGSDLDRVFRLYRRALGRPPEMAETARILEFVAEGDRAEAWTSACQAVLGCTEFRFAE